MGARIVSKYHLSYLVLSISLFLIHVIRSCVIDLYLLGLSSLKFTLEELRNKYKRIPEEELTNSLIEWDEMLKLRKEKCIHDGKCASGVKCEVGRTAQSIHMFSGAILPIWTDIESALKTNSKSKTKSRLRIVRVVTDDKQRLVGIRTDPKVKSFYVPIYI